MAYNEFEKYLEKANKTNQKYRLTRFWRNPKESHKKLLETNREEVERAMDVFAINGTWMQGDKEYCEELKQEGFFGKE